MAFFIFISPHLGEDRPRRFITHGVSSSGVIYRVFSLAVDPERR